MAVAKTLFSRCRFPFDWPPAVSHMGRTSHSDIRGGVLCCYWDLILIISRTFGAGLRMPIDTLDNDWLEHLRQPVSDRMPHASLQAISSLAIRGAWGMQIFREAKCLAGSIL